MTGAEERSIKLGRLRGMMEARGLDGVFLKRQDNFAWLTGGGINYVGLGEMGNCGLLVTQKGTYAVTNNIEAPRMRDEEKLGIRYRDIHNYLRLGTSGDPETDEKIRRREQANLHKRRMPVVL